MADIDKNQAVIDFLTTCPLLNGSVFFNFATEKDNTVSIITNTNDVATAKTFVDGTSLRIFSFTLINYKSLTHNAIIKLPGYSNENVDELYDIQGVLNWINEQAENRNFPNFGEDCLIDSMQTMSDNPNFDGIDGTVAPPMARYSVKVVIEYIDKTKQIYTGGNNNVI